MLAGRAVQDGPRQVGMVVGQPLHHFQRDGAQPEQPGRLGIRIEQRVILAHLFLDLGIVRQQVAGGVGLRLAEDLPRGLALRGAVVGAVLRDHPGRRRRNLGTQQHHVVMVVRHHGVIIL